ncbi:Cytochrome c, class I [hydrothermal vent metagenome]|uniref:Cytochrome c, class I n=1 Tax=hydrothermal vent metagenome TaxID=652676 RepID=A0A3B1BIE5_9ZZZZ
MIKMLLFFIFPFLTISCGENNAETKVDGRWYTQSQVNSGRLVFEKNCAECHGKNAQGTFSWTRKRADGSYPPPPLNGTAHTWHHSMKLLKRTINDGGIPLGGKMPGFKDKLTEKEKNEVIAFFQSQWSKKIYDAWAKRGGLN